jgi:hypothetical protein
VSTSVFLGGEGPNELGSRYGDPAYQTGDSPGVIEALLTRIRPDGWTVIGACKWCRIVKLRARGPTPTEAQNVLGLAHEAARSRADVLAFIRDEDDDKRRPQVIEEAVTTARQAFPSLAIVGATAVSVLEGWILALLGESRTETLHKAAAQRRMVEKGIKKKNTAAMVKVVASADLQTIPKDAASLRGWIDLARAALGADSAGT